MYVRITMPIAEPITVNREQLIRSFIATLNGLMQKDNVVHMAHTVAVQSVMRRFLSMVMIGWIRSNPVISVYGTSCPLFAAITLSSKMKKIWLNNIRMYKKIMECFIMKFFM